MVMFHDAMDDMQQLLTEAEREKAKWQPVGDVLLEALQTEIDKVKVGGTLFHPSLSNFLPSSLPLPPPLSTFILLSPSLSLSLLHMVVLAQFVTIKYYNFIIK